MHRPGLLLISLLFALPSTRADEPLAVDFTNDVMPVLSKAGCNLGTCHGNLNGKGGLKLSLRGQDPQFDFDALVMAARGRRVNLTAAELSLFLQKATGSVPHRGGIRFATDSQPYRLLKQWIEAGAPGPTSTAPRLVRLQVQPTEAIVVDPQHELPIQVEAFFSDGSSRDVTDTACYELSNLNAVVSADGVISRRKYGETTLIVRYLQEQRPVPVAFTESRLDFQWDEPTEFNEIDTHVFAKLKRLRINPSALTEDATFVRRAYLDAIGRLPTVEEAKQFVSDDGQDKRSRLIDQLVMRPEFADFWALKWADILRTEEKVLDTKGVEVFHAWIRDGIATGRPLNQFVSDLVTGVGSTWEQPAANYYRANRDPSTRGETTARLFLGTRLQCAKCHNHPFDRWTQDDYYQWSSLFSQIGYEIGENKRKDDLDKNEFVGDQTVLVAKTEEIRNPTTNQVALPKFLGGEVLNEKHLDDRLAALAAWLTSADNRLFVQSQTNFIWYQVMGQGIVDPIDDFRLTNPPSNPALLESLATSFADSGFDVRSLVAKIMKSRTYQLSSEPNSTNINDTTSYSRAYVRRLPAEVILDMQSDVLESPAEFQGYPEGIRAVQIPGTNREKVRGIPREQGDRFLKTFGKPDRILACDCERSNETTLKQVFVLIGDGLSTRLAAKNNRLKRLASTSDAEAINELYWAALSRAPTDIEQSAAIQMLSASGDDRASALEDIAWAILNAKEFLFRK
jgi:Protein of unknown function (DUF1549)/Protein of unknown function (DUF1553)